MPRPERALDPTTGAVEEFAAGLRQLREKAGRPGYRELARRAHYSTTTLSVAAAGRQLPSLAVTLAYVEACGGDRVAWEARWRTLAAELGVPESDPGRGNGRDEQPPYRGLATYEPADADWFFGRERLVAELVDRLAERRFLAVFGPSGCGKSSLLRAGLLPRFGTAGPDGAVLVTPGARPLAQLATRLVRLAGSPADLLLDEVTADPTRLPHVVARAMADRPAEAELLLVVDQFEEVFTLCRDEPERAVFVATLLSLARERDSRVRVVIGMRADFYARCAEYSDLVAALRDAQVLVGPMSAAELREAVVRPAERAGLMVEGALLSTIVMEVAGRPGALPLVSHALLEAWRRRRGNAVTLSGYEAAGGIEGALAKTAEAVYTAFTPSQRNAARDLFLRLTVPGDGSEDAKRQITRGELDTDDPDTGTVLNTLAEARLITLADNTVDLAHEALLRSWPRLRQWLAADREGRRVHRQLTEAAQSWESLDRDAGALYRGTRLAVAREWTAVESGVSRLSPLEDAFLRASVALDDSERVAAHRRGRLLRYLTVGLAVLLVAATGFGVVAIQQRHDAERAQRFATSRQLATQALASVDSQPETAMLLSVEAYRMAPTTEARSALLSMSAHQAYQGRLTGHTAAISQVASSPDGRILATVSRDRTIALWDTHRRTRVAVLSGHDTWLRAVAFSPDGSLLATGGDDQKTVIWDVAGRTRVATIGGHAAPVLGLAWSPSGRALAVASADRTVTVWDTGGWSRTATLLGHLDAVNDLTFSPDGRTVATAGLDQTVRLWNAETGAATAVLTGHSASVDSVAFSPDGRTLASASRDRSTVLWDVERRAVRVRLEGGHSDMIRVTAFSPDGRTLATAGHDRTIVLWDTEHNTIRARLTGTPNNIYSLTFNPRTSTIASAGEDGAVFLWDPSRSAMLLPGQTDQVSDVAFSPDGHTVATVNADRTTLWDIRRRIPLAVLRGHTDLVDAAAFSPDGRTLATVGRDHAVVLWTVENRLPAARLTGHTDRVLDAAFSPDGRILATAGVDRSVILWDVESRTRLASLTGPAGPINGVAFSPDGGTLATASHDRTVMLWDVARRSHQATLTGHTAWVRTVAFSPDGRTLASTSIDQTAIVWDVPGRSRLATLSGHTDAANGVAFSPDGTTVAYASSDHAVTLWDITRGTLHARLSGHTEPVKAVAFGPDGRTLVSAGADHAVIVWNLDAAQNATRTCDALARNLTRDEWKQFVPDAAYHRTCITQVPA